MRPGWRMAAIALAAVALPTLASSQERPPAPSALRVVRHVLTTGIVNMEPIDGATVFPASVEALYYFTEVVGASAPTEIVHTWYYRGREVAHIPLVVGSARWRTWSRKRILSHWIGPWEVEAVDQEGKVLSSQTFDVR